MMDTLMCVLSRERFPLVETKTRIKVKGTPRPEGGRPYHYQWRKGGQEIRGTRTNRSSFWRHSERKMGCFKSTRKQE